MENSAGWIRNKSALRRGNPWALIRTIRPGKDDIVVPRSPAVPGESRSAVHMIRSQDVIHNFFVRELRLQQTPRRGWWCRCISRRTRSGSTKSCAHNCAGWDIRGCSFIRMWCLTRITRLSSEAAGSGGAVSAILRMRSVRLVSENRNSRRLRNEFARAHGWAVDTRRWREPFCTFHPEYIFSADHKVIGIQYFLSAPDGGDRIGVIDADAFYWRGERDFAVRERRADVAGAVSGAGDDARGRSWFSSC